MIKVIKFGAGWPMEYYIATEGFVPSSYLQVGNIFPTSNVINTLRCNTRTYTVFHSIILFKAPQGILDSNLICRHVQML